MQMFQDVQNNLIVILSGTKGVGKTWFACTLAEAMGRQSKKILFFDADAGAENIAFYFGFKKSLLYANLLKGFVTINNAVSHFAKGHFDVIYANPMENVLNRYPSGRAQILACDLTNLSKLYKHVIVDCSDDNPFLKNILVQSAGQVILLVGASKNALSEAYNELEKIKKITNRGCVNIVVNRALSKTEGERIFETLSLANDQFVGLKMRLLGVINQDGNIRDSLVNQTSIFERYPTSENVKNMERIATMIEQEV